VQRWIARINAALLAVDPHSVGVTAATTLDALPQRERAVALASVALAEGTPIVVLDQLDTFAFETDETDFIRTVCRLALPETTIVLSTPVPVALASLGTSDGRPLVGIDLFENVGTSGASL